MSLNRYDRLLILFLACVLGFVLWLPRAAAEPASVQLSAVPHLSLEDR